jgi:peptide/nickel transport system permease protein
MSQEATVVIESPFRIAVRRFLHHRLAVVATVVLLIIVVVSFGAPLFTRFGPLEVDFSRMYQRPSLENPFGTDELGRDVLSRTLYGGRISLLVGLSAAFLSTIIGVFLGAVAGYYGKAVDTIIMRFTDVMMTFPPLIVMLTVAALVRPRLINIIIIIGALRWPPTTRLVRGQFLSLKTREYVLAAQAMGLPSRIVILRHCLPGVIPLLMAQISFAVSMAILSEAGMSFLGIGISLPTPSWGNMMQQARSVGVLQQYTWIWMFPALMTLLTIMCTNFIGDGLRDALDPQQMIKKG